MRPLLDVRVDACTCRVCVDATQHGWGVGASAADGEAGSGAAAVLFPVPVVIGTGAGAKLERPTHHELCWCGMPCYDSLWLIWLKYVLYADIMFAGRD